MNRVSLTCLIGGLFHVNDIVLQHGILDNSHIIQIDLAQCYPVISFGEEVNAFVWKEGKDRLG